MEPKDELLCPQEPPLVLLGPSPVPHEFSQHPHKRQVSQIVSFLHVFPLKFCTYFQRSQVIPNFGQVGKNKYVAIIYDKFNERE